MGGSDIKVKIDKNKTHESINSLTNAISVLSEKLEKTQKRLEETENDFFVYKTKLTTEISLLREEKVDLNIELKQSKDEVEDLKCKLQLKEQQLESLGKDMSKLIKTVTGIYENLLNMGGVLRG